MFVKDHMTANPITITPETPIFQALEIMTRKKVRHLPVLDKSGRVVGLVTERGLLQVSPSPATTLSVYELNYVLAKVTVKEALVKNPISVDPELPIEEAAQIMHEKKIGSLLVTQDDRLVGILTQTDVIASVVRLFGLHKAGTRLVIETRDRTGLLADLTKILKDMNINIRSVATMEVEPGHYHLMLRVSLADAGPLVAELESKGFNVVSVN